jgi:GDP-4-dehydro-6-deoxy-D-mannose reductase
MSGAPARAAARVLVTGAGGFVGRWLLQALSARLPPAAALVAAARQAPASAGGVRGVRLDVTDREQAEAVVRAVEPTCVVHLAGIAAVEAARRDPGRAWDVNLFGTLNMAEAVLRHAPGARFVFVGTAEAYGGTFKAWDRPLDERAPLDPATVYAATKAAADLAIGQMARDGLQAVRLRPFNHTGPGQSERFVAPAFAAQVARIERGVQAPVIRVGNLEARRDFLDVRDVAAAYAAAALHAGPLEPGLILNLASGEARRIGSILDALLRAARVPIRVEADPARLRAHDTPVAAGDAGRARAVLGWAPRRAWDETLRDVLDHWRNAP